MLGIQSLPVFYCHGFAPGLWFHKTTMIFWIVATYTRFLRVALLTQYALASAGPRVSLQGKMEHTKVAWHKKVCRVDACWLLFAIPSTQMHRRVQYANYIL
jgi:hypothetical protein